MVDTDRYVTDSGVKWFLVASTLVTSYVLATFEGIADLVVAIFNVPANLLYDGLSWLGETLGLGFEVPETSLEDAWEIAADVFPIAGPLDWILGVVIIAVFFAAVTWMIGRVREGL